MSGVWGNLDWVPSSTCRPQQEANAGERDRACILWELDSPGDGQLWAPFDGSPGQHVLATHLIALFRHKWYNIAHNHIASVRVLRKVRWPALSMLSLCISFPMQTVITFQMVTVLPRATSLSSVISGSLLGTWAGARTGWTTHLVSPKYKLKNYKIWVSSLQIFSDMGKWALF